VTATSVPAPAAVALRHNEPGTFTQEGRA